MKNSMLVIVFAIISTFLINGCTGKNQKGTNSEQKTPATEKVVYTCPMHPEIIRYEPGKCPKCGMDLVKKEPDQNSGDTLKK